MSFIRLTPTTGLTDTQRAAVLALQEFNIGLAQEAMATRGCVTVAERYDALLLCRSTTALALIRQCRDVQARCSIIDALQAKIDRLLLRSASHV